MRHNSVRPVTKVDLSDPAVWHMGVPKEEFLRLRREAPVAWNERFDGHRGFWAVSRYDDIVEVSRSTELYSSRNGVISLDDFDDAQNEARRTLLEMDPPQHTAMRQITRNAFGAKEISHLETAVRATASRLVEEALEEGDVDIVAKIAKQLPIRTLCRLMGIPESRREDMIRWSDLLIGSDDPDFIDPAYAAVPQAERRLLPFGHPASLEAFELGLELAGARHKNGEGDIVTVLAQGTVDGRPLTESEFCNYFLMLMVAGNETTRHSISHGIKALADNPGEWDRFRGGGIDSKVAGNEVIRWATPVHFVRRIAVGDADLGGARISAGDKVAMYYASGNRDEAHFEAPDRFIIDRAPNPHMAFGKGGPHFCLGNNVAQLQIRILLEEMSKRVAAFELTGPMDRLRSNHVHGVKRLPVRLIPVEN